MSRKNHPLEIVLCHTGHAELVNANGDVLWSSDADEDFKETVSQEFLTEDDVDKILDFLSEHEFLTDEEVAKFENDEWDITEESLDGSEAGTESDDSDVIADDDGDDY